MNMPGGHDPPRAAMGRCVEAVESRLGPKAELDNDKWLRNIS